MHELPVSMGEMDHQHRHPCCMTGYWKPHTMVHLSFGMQAAHSSFPAAPATPLVPSMSAAPACPARHTRGGCGDAAPPAVGAGAAGGNRWLSLFCILLALLAPPASLRRVLCIRV